jgi:hypothetical protein
VNVLSRKSATLKRKRFQAHAAVALGAFFSMSLGTLVSGFLKKQLGKDWFKMHVAFQLIGSLLVIAALAIALREARGETSVAFEWGRADSDVKKRAHGGVGVALVVCVVAQVALGFFREAKGTLLRGREKQKRTRLDGHEERLAVRYAMRTWSVRHTNVRMGNQRRRFEKRTSLWVGS